MKKPICLLFTTVALIFYSCTSGQKGSSGFDLNALDYANKINQTTDATIIDVRTPEEFSKGHLINAKNIDWNGNDFESQVNQIDKSKPVFVYCLSGGRSSSAVNKMRSLGFKEVYNLAGGIMKWRGANLPETTNAATTSTSMSLQQFDELHNTTKIVLIDFYAEWCGPCKRMKPYLDEIAATMKDSVTVIRINADDNQQLTKDLNIDALPTLMLYKNRLLTWRNTGFISKEDVMNEIVKR